MQQELPTVESLTAQITNMVVQRAQAKDQVEAIERTMPILQAQLQLLQAQKAEAEKTKD
jgi:protein subunit release factor A